MGKAPATIECGEPFTFAGYGGAPDKTVPCSLPAQRNLHADMITLGVSSDDEIRKGFLSSKFETALQEQGRAPDPLQPRDKHDAKRLHEKLGRVYVGNDTSGMSAKAQRAIAKGERKEYAYQNGGALHDG